MTEYECICPPEEDGPRSLRVRRNDCSVHGLLTSYRLGVATLGTLDPATDLAEYNELVEHLDSIWYKLSESERMLFGLRESP